MQEYTIENVEEKISASGKPFWLVYANGEKLGSIAPFKKPLADFLSNKVGQSIKLEIEENNGYTNVMNADGFVEDDIQPAGKFSKPARKSSYGAKADPAKLVSIERQAVAKMVMGYYGAKGLELTQEKFTATADFVYKWVHNETR